MNKTFQSLAAVAVLMVACVFAGCSKSDDDSNKDSGTKDTTADIVPVTGISVSADTLDLYTDSVKVINVDIAPANATSKNVTWSVSDDKVVSVDNGKVTALRPGSAVVTAIHKGFTAKCVVNVKPTVMLVYINYSDANATKCFAHLWRNGTVTDLSGGTEKTIASAVTASGGNVYVAGRSVNGSSHSAIYWKNGSASVLNTGTSYLARAISVSGNDVYVAGRTFNVVNRKYVGTYWKNGNKVDVDGGSAGVSVALSDIHVNSGKVYLCGYEGTVSAGTSLRQAVMYIDGAKTRLCNNVVSDALGGALSGSDYYVAGYFQNDSVSVAVYWKNGKMVTLSDGRCNAAATCVFVDGNDVYVGGYEENEEGIDIAKYWKNGVSCPVSDGKEVTRIEGISVSGDDVYTYGYGYSSGYFINLWKNNTLLTTVYDGDEDYEIFSDHGCCLYVR